MCPFAVDYFFGNKKGRMVIKSNNYTFQNEIVLKAPSGEMIYK